MVQARHFAALFYAALNELTALGGFSPPISRLSKYQWQAYGIYFSAKLNINIGVIWCFV